MAVRLDVRSDIDRVIAEFRADTDKVGTATTRALNRALDRAATETSREIRKVYNVKDRAVKAALTKIRAGKNRHLATLRIEGARIPLIEFDARWRPGQAVGATVKILVGAGRKPIAGAFIGASTANNARGGGSMGMTQVWRRKGRTRYPIVTLRSVSIPQAFGNKVVLEAVQRLVQEAFVTEFERQLTYLGGGDGG